MSFAADIESLSITTTTTASRLTALTDVTALIDRASPIVRRRFLDLIEGSRALLDLEVLAAAVESGQIEIAISIADRIGPGLSTALESAYAASGIAIAEVLSGATDSIIDFSTLGPRAILHNTETRARLVQEITAGQRLMLTDTITDGIGRGLRGDQIARELRESIGLTSHQRRAVGNYRRSLQEGSTKALNRTLRDRRFDASVRRNLASAGANRVPLTTAQIDRMTDRYRTRFVAHRAETISFTETQRAVSAADEELYRQAIESGDIDADDLSNEWRTARDERVRSSHRRMNTQQQPFGVPFRSGDGNDLRFPGDPNAPASDTVRCRCTIVRKLAKPVRR